METMNCTTKRTMLMLLLLLFIQCRFLATEPLSKFIRHYEPLDYDVDGVLKRHHRTKRSTSEILNLDFNAHGRDFKLRLKRDTLVYTPDVRIVTSRGDQTTDLHRAYIGYVEESPNSHVHGVLTTSGHFEGKIYMGNETFSVEKAERYFTRNRESLFHSVIYNDNDIEFDRSGISCLSNWIHKKLDLRKRNLTTSGKSDGSAQTLNSVGDMSKTHVTSVVGSEHFLPTFSQTLEQRLNTLVRSNAIKNVYPDSLTKDAQNGGTQIDSMPTMSENIYSRPKRAVLNKEKRTCELYLQADHLFYQHHGSNTETVIEQLTQHVQAVNAIYKNVDFDKDGTPDEIGFIIKKIKIHTDPNIKGYRYNGNYGVEKFLELVSEENYEFVCLAYMFTYRDFEGGTLGLAWTADLYNAGGICDKYNQYQGAMKSLNTGIVTVLNFGQFVPPTVSYVTLAHEIGHNMGSPHDPNTAECTPSGDSGNYIMYARATSSDRPNNEKFSSCSISSMGPVVDARGRGTDGCFTVYTGSICGNKVVEEGEECDCGWDDECREKCCNPQTSNSSAPNACTLKPLASCSPSAGLCCTEECEIVPSNVNKLCRAESSCQEAAFCAGETFNAVCPKSQSKPNKTECGPSSVCFQGECTGSLCVVYGLEPCQCSPLKDGDWFDEKLCHLCCKTPGPNSVCRSSHEFNSGNYILPNTSSQPGSPCYNYQGFCDVFHKCREVDPSGPLQNIRKLLFSGETIETIKDWLETYWYAAVLGFIGLIASMALFIKICSKSTLPSKSVSPEQPEASHRSKLGRKLSGMRSKRSRVRSSSEDHKV